MIKDNSKVDLCNLRHYLVRDFHAEFAQNQNHHQSIVIKIFAASIALIAVFVYATLYQETYLNQLDLEKLNSTEKPIHILMECPYIVSNDLYNILVFIIVALFIIFFLYICQVGYAFRRDQKIVQRIRDTEKLNDDIFRYYGKAKLFFFLPDFYFILLLLIIISTCKVIKWTEDLISLKNKSISYSPILMIGIYLYYLNKYIYCIM